MFMLAFAAAALLAAQPAPAYKRKMHRPPAVGSAAEPSVLQERWLRRRVVRLARIKMLERREAVLFDFLARAHTETPLFVDPHVAAAGAGISIGPTTVTLDFLGSPIVRATVRNTSASRAAPLLTVTLRAADGTTSRASVLVETLDAGAARTVELLSPTRGRPTSLSWSVQE